MHIRNCQLVHGCWVVLVAGMIAKRAAKLVCTWMRLAASELGGKYKMQQETICCHNHQRT